MSFLSAVAPILEGELQSLGFKRVEFSEAFSLGAGTPVAYRTVYCRIRDEFVTPEIPVLYLKDFDPAAVEYGDVFTDAYWKPPNSKWWDNYAQEDVVIIDEFYGWLPSIIISFGALPLPVMNFFS